MRLVKDGGRFDELQSILIGGIVDSIKGRLDAAKLPPEIARELLENISFDVAAILDASSSVEYEGVEATPVIAFMDGDNRLIYPGGNSWMHEYVLGTISDIYGE